VSLLEAILSRKRDELVDLEEATRVPSARTGLDALRALRRDDPTDRMRLIAEVKLRSPSAGPLSRALTPEARALAYARAGAAMVSVLCDRTFFDGSFTHLDAARRALDEASLPVPLLAKEFVLYPRQIEEARDRGADAVLLIARIVDAGTLKELAGAARDEGIEPLVEVVDEAELDAALAADARIIGVNARDLDTLVIDTERTARVLARIPTGVVAVHLSGLKTAADVSQVARTRADAALVGEALMRQDDPSSLLVELVAAAAGK